MRACCACRAESVPPSARVAASTVVAALNALAATAADAKLALGEIGVSSFVKHKKHAAIRHLAVIFTEG